MYRRKDMEGSYKFLNIFSPSRSMQYSTTAYTTNNRLSTPRLCLSVINGYKASALVKRSINSVRTPPENTCKRSQVEARNLENRK